MISILLAAYNGEKYITEQIDSILSQTYQDFTLYIQDDKSTDSTYKIISEYAQRFPQKVVVSQNEENVGGSKFNFLQMMMKYQSTFNSDHWLTRIREILKTHI